MRYKVEDLYKLLIEENKSYEEVGRMYNVTGKAVKKAAIRLGISLPQRRSINPTETHNKGISKVPLGICSYCGKEYKLKKYGSTKYCSLKCQREHKHTLAYNKVLESDKSIMRANYSPALFRNDILKEQDNKCAICGINPAWNNKPLVFIIDHIDGDAANNSRDNLRCICPNCDSQLDTYKSKNKNGARHYYRYRMQG